MRVKRIPRAAAVLVWMSGAVAMHALVPFELSRLDRRTQRQPATPLVVRGSGLLAVVAGASLMAWALAAHHKAAPRGWAVPTTRQMRSGVPYRLEYLLRKGPYRLTRNPMYLGEAAVWLGWALFYGSRSVWAGLAVMCAAFTRIVPWEERLLLERFGDDYRAYLASVPRWVRFGPGL
jgi:protein-S-isoprenylcysteine O-methyltransferase Ste14